MSEPAWLSEKMGICTVAGIDPDTFYTVFHLLLHAAYQEGRLSVLEEAFAKAPKQSICLEHHDDRPSEPA